MKFAISNIALPSHNHMEEMGHLAAIGFHPEPNSRALIEAGLNCISISVEGTDELAFEQARIGARFNRINRNPETPS